MKITRKVFLKAAGGVAAALSFFYPGATGVLGGRGSESHRLSAPAEAAPAADARRITGPDPTYAGGEVVVKTAEGVILQSHARTRAVRIPAGTVVWKEFDVPPDAIQLHDWVDVNGTPLADGSLLARSGWVFVNIGRVRGVVEGVSPRGLTLRSTKGTATIELSSRLEVLHGTDGTPLAGGVTALQPGMQIGAVGLTLPNGGFRATRIWTA